LARPSTEECAPSVLPKRKPRNRPRDSYTPAAWINETLFRSVELQFRQARTPAGQEMSIQAIKSCPCSPAVYHARGGDFCAGAEKHTCTSAETVSTLSNPRFLTPSIGEKNDRLSPERLPRPTSAPRSSCPNFPWGSAQSPGRRAHRRSASPRWNPTAENPLAVRIHRWRFSKSQ